MNPALRRLVRKGAPPAAEVEAFFRGNDFPLVDGSKVTFVFHGEADEVYLRCWVSGFNTAQPFQNIPQTNLWAAVIDLPPGSRIEYKFEVVIGQQRQLILDPLNEVVAPDPFGANSVCQGYGYERPAWSLPDAETRSGALEDLAIDSQAFQDRREVTVYLPARFRRNRRYPLLVVHDGLDYLKYADFKDVLDNLIHYLEIPQMIIALTQSPDRLKEYAAYDKHADFLALDLLPTLRERYPLTNERATTGIMGASFGGVAALHGAWRYPELYGCLLLQSGSFAFSDIGRHGRGPVFDPVAKFMNTFREDTGKLSGKIYMSCGVYESLIYENRSLLPKLQKPGLEVQFEESRDAHNWENWRDRLRMGLTWLFPGPSWIVYE